MSAPAPDDLTVASAQAAQAPQDEAPIDALPELGADESDNDSAYESVGGSDGGTSVTSSILQGYTEHGRRYQVTRETNLNVPSDEQQFSSMFTKHLCLRVLESLQENPHFRSPISKDAQHILDLGTGDGAWALDVADMLPNATVHGVDLYPPPKDWVAPNCIFEVDDFLKPWTWALKFDLIHIRNLIGAMPRSDWKKLYRQAYENLQPGGWIEHFDVDINIRSNDNIKPMPEDSKLAHLGELFHASAKKSGNASDVTDFMKEEIETVGFVNVKEVIYKVPLGDWPKHPIYKEAGRLSLSQYKQGMEGWLMWLFTKFGSPEPWTPEECAAYLEKLREELDQGYHIFEYHKRVYAQKPFDEVKV